LVDFIVDEVDAFTMFLVLWMSDRILEAEDVDILGIA
jgi:hypothetical protein